MILLSQVLNGVLLPFVLIFMILLINRKDLMGEWVNPRWFNLVILDHGGLHDRQLWHP
jgi:Mn2+/Fe2+ NRAMP family transporter